MFSYTNILLIYPPNIPNVLPLHRFIVYLLMLPEHDIVCVTNIFVFSYFIPHTIANAVIQHDVCIKTYLPFNHLIHRGSTVKRIMILKHSYDGTIQLSKINGNKLEIAFVISIYLRT